MENHNTSWGLIGFILAFISPLLHELGIVVQAVASISGLVLMFYAIHYKRLQIKKLKKEIEDADQRSK